jgi:tetratricopeptide (TPR) repeat protein
LKKFPDNEFFIYEIAEDLFDNKKYEECKRFILESKKKINIIQWVEYSHLRLTFLKTLLCLKEFKDAEKLLNIPIDSEHTTAFFKGILYYESRRYEKAIDCFLEAIQKDIYNGSETMASFYCLLGCYIKTRNNQKIEDTIKEFPLTQDEFSLVLFSFYYQDIAKKILKNSLKIALSDLAKAKIKGLLAYMSHEKLPKPEESEDKRKLTKTEEKDLSRGIGLIKNALLFYPRNRFFNIIYSNFLFFKDNYDEAMKHSLRTIGDTDAEYFSAYVTLEKCSDNFLENYAKHLEQELYGSKASFSDYIEFMFEWDIGTLFKRGKYHAITKLFNWLKDELDLKKIGEIGNRYGGGGLFEIAYSFKEVGDTKQAKNIYEKEKELHGETSAVLNNLAIIYEKEGILKKAKEYIKKAKNLAEKDDEIVNQNYERLAHYSKEKSVERRGIKDLPLNEEKQMQKKTKIPQIFEVKVEDRYIWVNNYLLSKPHAVGSNFEFFEYVRSQLQGIKIERNKLQGPGGPSLKQEVKSKGFIKILNELGFKGEILKAFFPKRGKDALIYRGDRITKKDLEKAGVRASLFIKELELAHLKNSPE